MFGTGVDFNIQGKGSKYKTLRGSLISVIIVALILVYGSKKFVTMLTDTLPVLGLQVCPKSEEKCGHC